ncbi:hypothetical protein D3C75_1033110 [compost metagenome]
MARAAGSRCPHTDQLHAYRHVGDRRAGNFTHARDLHAIAVQCGTVFGYHHDHGAAPTLLHRVDEAGHVTEHHLRTRLVVGSVGTTIGADDAVAVVQRDRVVEQRDLLGGFGLALLEPAVQHVAIATQR